MDAFPQEYTGWHLYSATNLLNPFWQVIPSQSGTTIEIPTAKPQEIFRLGSP